MARLAIFAMLPVMALLVWRDVVVERELRLMTAAGAALAVDGDRRTVARDSELNEALWSLLLRQPQAALAQVQASERLSPLAMPETARTIEAAARCMLDERNAKADGSRLGQFCAAERSRAPR